MINFQKLEIDDCKRLASEIYSNTVFCNFMVQKKDESLVSSIFMPLSSQEFMEFAKENLKNIGLVYEYWSSASTKKIGEYPVFMSMKLIDIQTSKIVNDYLKLIKSSKSKL